MSADARRPESAVQLSDILDLQRHFDGVVERAVGSVRTDLREEMRSGHDLLTAKMDGLAKAAKDAAIVHEQEHIEAEAEFRRARERYDAWLDREELNDAVRGAILGKFRYVWNTVAPHWKFLATLLLGLAGLLGNIQVGVGVS